MNLASKKLFSFRKPSVQKSRSGKFGKSLMLRHHTTATSNTANTAATANTRSTKKTFADKIGIKSKRKGKDWRWVA